MSAPAKKNRNYWDITDRPSSGALAKRRVAAAVRELAALTATTDAPEASLAEMAEILESAAARLRAHPTRTFRDAFASCRTEEDFAPFADRAVMTGLSNPFSPPMKLSMQGEKAVGKVRFGPAYEGVPGHVHGGLVAAALDETLGYLAVSSGIGGLTAVLTVRYRTPTPLDADLVIEASLVRSEGRKAFVEARMTAGDVVTAEAEGVFVAVDRARMLAVIDAAQKGQDKG